MFVLSRNVSAGYKAIATLVATALILALFGIQSFAEAANITSVYDRLSDSDVSALSNHTIDFRTPTGVSAGQSITVTFPAGFDLSSIVEDDVDLEVNGTDELTAAAPSGATWGVTVSGQTLTILSGTATIANTATVTIKIGTNAGGSGTGANRIVNPGATGSYEIDFAGTMADRGHTRVAIVDDVLVTARVNTSFTFTVNGRATSTAVNGQTTTRASSPTTIPFGTLTAGAAQTLAHNLVVATNAIHGFVVTVEEDQHLLSSTGADIDNFVNGSDAPTPNTWSSPSNSVGNENTWGHWGVTSSDTDTTRVAGDEFGANEWQGVSSTPQVVFSHAGPADGSSAGIGSTTVGYRAEITALQEAADDYSTTLTYIATPTF
jgi:hypothetical protein